MKRMLTRAFIVFAACLWMLMVVGRQARVAAFEKVKSGNASVGRRGVRSTAVSPGGERQRQPARCEPCSGHGMTRRECFHGSKNYTGTHWVCLGCGLSDSVVAAGSRRWAETRCLRCQGQGVLRCDVCGGDGVL